MLEKTIGLVINPIGTDASQVGRIKAKINRSALLLCTFGSLIALDPQILSAVLTMVSSDFFSFSIIYHILTLVGSLACITGGILLLLSRSIIFPPTHVHLRDNVYMRPAHSRRGHRIRPRTKVLVVTFAFLALFAASPSNFVSACPTSTSSVGTFDLQTGYSLEANITGWVNTSTGEVFRTRVYDTLTLQFEARERGCYVIQVRDANSGVILVHSNFGQDPDSVFQLTTIAPGNYTYRVSLDPTREFNDARNFRPGRNYTVSIQYYQLLFGFIPVYFGATGNLPVEVLKAKTAIRYLPQGPYPIANRDSGIYIIDNTGYDLDPHHEVHYGGQLVNYHQPYTTLFGESVKIEAYNQTVGKFIPRAEVETDLVGRFAYFEKWYHRASDQTIMANYSFTGNDLYEPTYLADALDPENILTVWDFDGPGTVTPDETDGVESLGSTAVNTKTELRRTWTFVNTSSTQGFTLGAVDTPWYKFGASRGEGALYFGTYSTIDMTATLYTPELWYLGTAVAESNLAVRFRTFHERNWLRDPEPPNAIFTITAFLEDQHGHRAFEAPLFAGNITDYETVILNLPPAIFGAPAIFRVGFDLSISTSDKAAWLDLADEFYLFLQVVDLHLRYPTPQWGASGALDGFAGFTSQISTTALCYAPLISGEVLTLSNNLGGITSPAGTNVSGYDVTDRSFATNPFGTANSWNLSTIMDGCGWASGNRGIITEPTDYWDLTGPTHPDVSFQYHDSICVSGGLAMTSVPGICLEDDNTWGAVAMHFILPDLPSSLTYEQLTFSHAIATSWYWGLSAYKLTVLLVAPGGGVSTLYTTGNRYAGLSKTIWTHEISLTGDASGSYSIVFLAETLPACLGNLPVTIFFDDLTIEATTRAEAAIMHLSCQSGPAGNKGPLQAKGSLDLPVSLDFAAPELAGSSVEIEFSVTLAQWLSSTWDGPGTFHMGLVSHLGDGSSLPAREVLAGTVDGLMEFSSIVVDLSDLIGQDVQDLVLVLELDLPASSRGFANSLGRDTYSIWVESCRLQFDTAPVCEWVGDQMVVYQPETLDLTYKKHVTSGSTSLWLGAPCQSAAQEATGNVTAWAPLVDAEDLAGTAFDGIINITLIPCISGVDLTAVPVTLTLIFDLYTTDAGGNLAREVHVPVWSAILAPGSVIPGSESFLYELTPMFARFLGPDGDSFHGYQLRYSLIISTNEAGVVPEVGINLIECAIVFHDLPPEGTFTNINDGTVLYGTAGITIVSNTPDCKGVSLWGATQPDGPWYFLGDQFRETGTTSFTITLDTISNGIFSADLPILHLRAELWDGYTFRNTSSAVLVVDNTIPEISFGTSVNDGEVLAAPRTIGITTEATDIQYVEFWAKRYDGNLKLVDAILLAKDTIGTDGWEFEFIPWTLPAGVGYQFEALAVDQTLDPARAGYCVASDLTISWINPTFPIPTPANLTRVTGSVQFVFTSGTSALDDVCVAISETPGNSLADATFGEYVVLPGNIEDMYEFSFDCETQFGFGVQDYYYLQLTFTAFDYATQVYYLLFIDTQPPEFAPELGAGIGVESQPHYYSVREPISSAAGFPELSTSFPSLTEGNWVGDQYLVPIDLHGAFTSDLETLHVIVEVYDLEHTTVTPWINYDVMSGFLQQDEGMLPYGGQLFPHDGDAYTFWVDFTDGLLATCEWLDQAGIVPLSYSDYYYLKLTAYLTTGFDPVWFSEEPIQLGITAAEFSLAFQHILDLVDSGYYAEVIWYIEEILKPRLTGMYSTAYNLPLGNPDEVTLYAWNGATAPPGVVTIDLGAIPDGILRFRVEGFDSVDNFGSGWTGLITLDKGFPVPAPIVPTPGSRVEIPHEYGSTVWDSATLDYHLFFPDGDVANWTLHSYRVQAPAVLYDETTIVERTQVIPRHSTWMFQHLVADEVRALFGEGLVTEANVTWDVTVREFSGRETFFTWNFTLCSTLDETAPEVLAVQLINPDGSLTTAIDPEYAWPGGPVLVLDVTDNIAVQYVEVWADVAPNIDADAIWPALLQSAPSVHGVLPGFLGITSETLYHLPNSWVIDPWLLAGIFNDFPAGTHTLYLRAVDVAFNTVTIQADITTTNLPLFNIAPDSEVYTPGGSGDLFVEILDPIPEYSQVSFVLMDSDYNWINGIADTVGSDGWSVTFPSVNPGAWNLCAISHLSNTYPQLLYAHRVICPSWVSGIIPSAGVWDYGDLVSFTVNDDYPHDLDLGLVEGAVIWDFVDFDTQWEGTSIATNVRVLVDNIPSIHAVALDPVDDNAVTFRLNTYNLPDGPHELQLEVIFANGKVGTSDPISIIVDNSVPAWSGVGVSVNGVSQWTSTVYTSGNLAININAIDLETPITRLRVWLGDENDPRQACLNELSFAEPVITEDLSISLTEDGPVGLQDGWHILVVDVESVGGVLHGRPFEICLDRGFPGGSFAYPAETSHEFLGSTVELSFLPTPPTSAESPVARVEFFLQDAAATSFTDYIDLGVARPHLDGTILSYTLQCAHNLEIEQTVRFWARVTDAAGNEQLIPTSYWHVVRPFDVLIEGGDVVLLTEGQTLTGSIANYLTSSQAIGPYEANLDIYSPALSDYVTIGTTNSFYGTEGSFEITWDPNSIPQSLLGSVIPVAVTEDADLSFILGTSNFALAGSFTDAGLTQILIVAGSPVNQFHLFTSDMASIYHWTHQPLVTTGVSLIGEILQAVSGDWDGDGTLEVCLLTPSVILFLDWTGTDWTLTSFDLETHDLAGIAYIVATAQGLLAASPGRVYQLNYMTGGTFTVLQSDAIPTGETTRAITCGILQGAVRPLLLTNNKVFLLDGIQWNLIFETQYALVPEIVVEDVCPSPEEEIVVGVIRTDGVDVVQVAWDATRNAWVTTLCTSFEHITHISGLAAGRLNPANLARVFVSHEVGLDMVSLDYAESPVETPLQVETSITDTGTATLNGRLQATTFETTNLEMTAGHVTTPADAITVTPVLGDSLSVTAPSAASEHEAYAEFDLYSPVNYPESSSHLASKQAFAYDAASDQYQASRVLNPYPGGYLNGIENFLQNTPPSSITYQTFGMYSPYLYNSGRSYFRGSFDWGTQIYTIENYDDYLAELGDYQFIKGDMYFDYYRSPMPNGHFVRSITPLARDDYYTNQWVASAQGVSRPDFAPSYWPSSGIFNNEFAEVGSTPDIFRYEQVVTYKFGQYQDPSTQDHAENFYQDFTAVRLWVYQQRFALSGESLSVTLRIGSWSQRVAVGYSGGCILTIPAATIQNYGWDLEDLANARITFHAGRDGPDCAYANWQDCGHLITHCRIDAEYDIAPMEIGIITRAVTESGGSTTFPAYFEKLSGTSQNGDFIYRFLLYPPSYGEYERIEFQFTANHPILNPIGYIQLKAQGMVYPDAPGFLPQSRVEFNSEFTIPFDPPGGGTITYASFEVPVSLDLQVFDVWDRTFSEASTDAVNFYTSCFEKSLTKLLVVHWTGDDWDYDNPDLEITSANWDGQLTFTATGELTAPASIAAVMAEGGLKFQVCAILEIDRDTWLVPGYTINEISVGWETVQSWVPILGVGAGARCGFDIVSAVPVEEINEGWNTLVLEHDTLPASQVTPSNFAGTLYTRFDLDLNEDIYAEMGLVDFCLDGQFPTFPLEITITDASTDIVSFAPGDLSLRVTYNGETKIDSLSNIITVPISALNEEFITVEFWAHSIQPGVFTTNTGGIVQRHFLVSYGAGPAATWQGDDPAIFAISIPIVPETGQDDVLSAEIIYSFGDPSVGTFTREFTLTVTNPEFDLSRLQGVQVLPHGTISHLVNPVGGVTSLTELFPTDVTMWENDDQKSFVRIQENPPYGSFQSMTISNTADTGADFPLRFNWYFGPDLPSTYYEVDSVSGAITFHFRFVVDQDFGLDESSTSILAVDFSAIDVILITLAPPDRTNAFVSHESAVEFTMDVNGMSGGLEMSATFQVDIHVSTQDGVDLPVNEHLVWGDEPGCKLLLHEAASGNFIEFGAVSTLWATRIEGDREIRELHVVAEASFYALTQVRSIAGGDTVSGRVLVRWAALNNRLETVILDVAVVTVDFHAITIARPFTTECISTTRLGTISAIDLNADGDTDCLTESGVALVTHSAVTAVPAQVIFTDLGADFSFSTSFLATLDAGEPRPHFRDLPVNGIPVFNEIVTLEVADYSHDLTRVDLYWEPGEVLLASFVKGTPEWPNDLARNYFTFTVDATMFGLERGLVDLRVESTNARGGTGSCSVQAIIDQVAPTSAVAFAPGTSRVEGETMVVSAQTYLIFEVCYDPMIDGLVEGLEVCLTGGILHNVWYPATAFTPGSNTIGLTLSLGTLLDDRDLTEDCVILSWRARDVAGNIEAPWNVLTVNIDPSITISLNSPTGQPLIPGETLDVRYGDTISGRATDSFSLPLPVGTPIDLCLDDLTYLRTEVSAGDGTFLVDVTSQDMFTIDLRGLPGVSFTGRGAPDVPTDTVTYEFFATQGSDPIIASRVMVTEGVKRHIGRNYPEAISLEYAGFDLAPSLVGRTFEGIQLDLLVPAIWADSGATFSSITVELVGTETSWNFTASTEYLLPLLQAGHHAVEWTDMQMAPLSLAIPLSEFEFNQLPLDLSQVHSIKVTGADNPVHPGIDFFVPTQAYQALACSGIRLVDLVNDWSLYHDAMVRTDPYSVVSGRAVVFGLPRTVDCEVNLQVIRDTPSFEAGVEGFPTSVHCDEQINLSGIALSEFSGLTSGLITDYLSIAGTVDLWSHPDNGVEYGLALGLPGGVADSRSFWVYATPLTYSGINLKYSGNGLFLPATTQIAPTFEIAPALTSIMIWDTAQGRPFHVDVPRGSNETLLGGRLLDGTNVPLVHRADNSLKSIISFHAWDIDSGWVFSETREILHAENILFGIVGDDGQPLWLESRILGNGLFNATLNNTVAGTLPLNPGTYTGIFHYLGTEFHAPVTRYFTFTIQPSDILIQTRDSEDPNSPVWKTPTSSMEFTNTITYSDTKTLEFRLLDTYDERPVEGAPVWIQVGFVPQIEYLSERSPYWCSGYYLTQDPPEELALRRYQQVGTGLPVLYPSAIGLTDSYQVFAPLYYGLVQTDENGTATFSLAGPVFESVLDQYEEWLHESWAGFESLELYIRVFYAPAFHDPSMRLPHEIVYGSTYTVDFGGNEGWVYDMADSPHTIESLYFDPVEEMYIDPLRAGAFIEGTLAFRKEDLMIVGAYQELYGAKEFTLLTSVVEADIENGQYFQEPEGSPDNFIDARGLREDETGIDSFGIALQIYDASDLNCLVPGEYITTLPDGTYSYQAYFQVADGAGVVELDCNRGIFGPYWDRLVPGEYVARYSAHPDEFYTHSRYYEWPVDGSSRFMLKSDSTYCLDAPSHLYSLPYLLASDPSVDITYIDVTNPDLSTKVAYESGLPYLTGTAVFQSSTTLPANYNLTDLVTVDIYAGEILLESLECAFDPSESTGGSGEPFTLAVPFEVPFNHLAGTTPDISLVARFLPDPLANLRWLYELEIDPEEVEDLDAYYLGYEIATWADYVPASQYSVQIQSLTLHEAISRADGQAWEIWRESPLSDPGDEYSEHHWISTDGTVIDTLSISPVITTVPEGFEGLMAVGAEGGAITFTIDGAVATTEFFETGEFSTRWSFAELIPVEKSVQKITREVDHDADPQTATLKESIEYDAGNILLHPSSAGSLDHSLRPAVYANEWDPEECDALYAGLQAGDQVSFTIPQIYLPYKANLNWTLRLPIIEGLEVEVAVDAIAHDLPAWHNEWLIMSIDSSTPEGCTEEFGFWWADLTEDMAPSLWSNFVNLSFSITLHAAPGQVTPVPLHFLYGYITGAENIVRLSTGYPRALRERLYSTNFLYFYSRYTKSLFGATETYTDEAIDDVYFEITDADSPDPYENDLTTILDAWDWRVHETNPTLYNNLDWWAYDGMSSPEMNALFHWNDNKGTFAEMPDPTPDSPGSESVWVRLKFNEQVLAGLQDPARYSGYVQLHDVDAQGEVDPLPLENAVRKVTVLVLPATWTQHPERTIVTGSGTTPTTYYTDLAATDISVPVRVTPEPTLDLSATVAYALEAGAGDLQIRDWDARVLRRNPDPLPQKGDSLEYNLTWDVINYPSYASLVTGDNAWQERAKLMGGAWTVDATPDVAGISSVSVVMDVSALGNLPDVYGGLQGYEYATLPVSLDDMTGATAVLVQFAGIDTYYFSREPDQAAFFEIIHVPLHGAALGQVRFTVYYDVPADLGTTYKPKLSVLGLGLYGYGSTAQVSVDCVVDGTLRTASYELLPTLVYSSMAPKTQIMALQDWVGDVWSSLTIQVITITTPRGGQRLELFDVAIGDIQRDGDLPGHFTASYYAYNFDPRQRVVETLLFSLYGPVSPLPEWQSTAPEFVSAEPMAWAYTQSIDYDYDGQYDLVLQFLDGEGIGNSQVYETLPDGTDLTYFDNGVQDTVSWDLGGDGTWDYVEKYDKATITYQASASGQYDAAAVACEAFLVSRLESVSYTLGEDYTGDGVLDEVTTYAWQRTLGAQPNFMEYLVDAETEVLEDQIPELGEGPWTPWQASIEHQYDTNADGSFEQITIQQDIFQNSPSATLESEIYETHYEYYVDEFGSDLVASNTLTEELTFLLLGADDDQLVSWEITRQASKSITGTFVVEHNVPVLLDPRPAIGKLWTDPHGVVAWYDSDADGYYETGFLFSEQSWEDQVAIAVYLSREGQGCLHANPTQLAQSGDLIIPGHWLSSKYGYTDVFQMGWKAAVDSFKASLYRPETWAMQAIDTAASAGIIATSALAGLSFGGIIGLGVGLLVGFALYSAYDYGVRPLVEETVLAAIYGDERARSLEKSLDGGNRWADALQGQFEQFLHDYSFAAFVDKNLYTFQEQAYFSDVGTYAGALGTSSTQYFLDVEIPKYWDVTGDTWLANLDIFQKIEQSGFFNDFTYEEQVIGAALDELDSPFASAIDYLMAHKVEYFDAQGNPLFSLEEFRTLVEQKTREYETERRHLIHEYFYHPGPDFPSDVTAYDAWDRAEVLLSVAPTDSRFTRLTYASGDKGQAILTAAYTRGVALEDTVGHAIDYLHSCLLSRYKTGYDSANKYDETIFWWKLGMQVVPAIIGVGAGTLARAHKLGVSFKVALCGSGTGTTARAVGKFAWEVAEEVVVEQVVSSVALALGAPPGLAEQIGEQMGGLDIIKNVLAIHEQKSEMKKETAESRAQRAHVVSTQPLSRTALQGSATQLVEALHAKLQVDRASSPSSQLLDIALTRLHHAETGGKITDIVRNTLANGLLEIRWVKDGRHFTLTDFPDPHVETRAIVEFVDAQLTSKVVDGTVTSANDLLDLQAINDYFGLAEAGRYYYLRLANSKTGASLTYTRHISRDAYGFFQGELEVVETAADGTVVTETLPLEKTEAGKWIVSDQWLGRGIDAINQGVGAYDTIQIVDPDDSGRKHAPLDEGDSIRNRWMAWKRMKLASGILGMEKLQGGIQSVTSDVLRQEFRAIAGNFDLTFQFSQHFLAGSEAFWATYPVLSPAMTDQAILRVFLGTEWLDQVEQAFPGIFDPSFAASIVTESVRQRERLVAAKNVGLLEEFTADKHYLDLWRALELVDTGIPMAAVTDLQAKGIWVREIVDIYSVNTGDGGVGYSGFICLLQTGLTHLLEGHKTQWEYYGFSTNEAILEIIGQTLLNPDLVQNLDTRRPRYYKKLWDTTGGIWFYATVWFDINSGTIQTAFPSTKEVI